MARGRKRKHDPSIPAHVDQARIPRGIYWDRSGAGRWYVRNPPGSAKATTTVATRTAKLSDLHAIAERRAGNDARGTVGLVITEFEASLEFSKLATRTQANYRAQGKIVRAHKTPMGLTLDQLQVERLSTAAIQRIVDRIAQGRPESRPGAGDGEAPKPTKANHLLRYLRRMFAWGVRLGYCNTNPAQGVRQADEVADAKMPERDAFASVLAFAGERGQRQAHTAGSVAPYLAPIMQIAYSCRLRGIEAATLTDAHALDLGIYCERRKGSDDNVTEWTPELRAAWDALVAQRAATWERRGCPIPIQPESRFLVVSEDGGPLRKSSLDTAWQRLMVAAVESGTITPSQRFTLHGLKHRGITDSADKTAGGHRTEAMRRKYDHSIALVKAAGDAEFSGQFSGATPIQRKRPR